jgi:NHL repeat
MNRFRRTHYAFSIGTAAALLAGCGGSQPPIGAPGAMSQSALSRVVAPWMRRFIQDSRVATIYRGATPSWIAPGASTQNLLYVSNGGADDVDMYSYPAGKAAGNLGGFKHPAGVCADKAGDVWIVDSGSSKIVEYAHAGKKPKATLTDAGALNLLGCSVDSTTGNLAVTDAGGPTGGGGVWMYTDAKGTPKEYQLHAIQFVYFCSYDDGGNLFVDGLGSGYGFAFAELASGGRALKSITLSQGVGFPGGVQWDGEYITIGDQVYENRHKAAIYQVSISGSTGTIQGTTVLPGSCDVLQFAISTLGSGKKDQQGSSVIAPDVCQNNVKFYKYPTRGAATKTLTGFQYPVGAAVSLAQ